MTDVSINPPEAVSQHTNPCRKEGNTAVCDGWINGNNVLCVMTVHWKEPLPSPEYRLLQFVDQQQVSALLIATKVRLAPYLATAEVKIKDLLKTAAEINEAGEKALTKS
jgi:hypothetical protein